MGELQVEALLGRLV